jgi:hypothetical protein
VHSAAALAHSFLQPADPLPSLPHTHTHQTGFGYNAGFDVGAGMLIIQTLSNHFPERLKRIVMTNTPFIFSAFWALVKVFLDERTSKKILFCSQAEIPAKLGVTLDQLPPFLGGTSTYTFDPAHVLGTDGQGLNSHYMSVTKGPMSHLPKETLDRAWEGLKEDPAAAAAAAAAAPAATAPAATADPAAAMAGGGGGGAQQHPSGSQ